MGVIDTTAEKNQQSRNGDCAGCLECRDTGIANALYGPTECTACVYSAHQVPASARRIHDCVLELLSRGKKIDRQLLETAQALAHSSFERPVPGDRLQVILKCDRRGLSDRMKQLRDEWHLPALGTRQQPNGYYIATTVEGFMHWRRHTRSQAISEFATLYRLERANFPELAGQQSLDFINGVSADLQEAIR